MDGRAAWLAVRSIGGPSDAAGAMLEAGEQDHCLDPRIWRRVFLLTDANCMFAPVCAIVCIITGLSNCTKAMARELFTLGLLGHVGLSSRS